MLVHASTSVRSGEAAIALLVISRFGISTAAVHAQWTPFADGKITAHAANAQ